MSKSWTLQMADTGSIVLENVFSNRVLRITASNYMFRRYPGRSSSKGYCIISHVNYMLWGNYVGVNKLIPGHWGECRNRLY